MLDLPRLERLSLTRYPLSQRLLGQLLKVNYGFLPGVRLELENEELIPSSPVIFAMNHTDRYNYWPFQYTIWQRHNRFTTTWVKGKYYEGRFMAAFMESMLQLPTVSRGYLITKDFHAAMGRTPTEQEYVLLRGAVDARAVGEAAPLPEPPDVPEMLYRKARNPLGVAYEPTDREAGDWADYVCRLFRAMMARFVALNEEAAEIGLDLLVFPQGTRSIRLLPGHIGISQIALHLKCPIVPIGCNGSDQVYPGASPFARRGHIVYRAGAPLTWDELSPFHPGVEFEPFSARAERDHAEAFQRLADLVTDRIESLLEPEYRRAAEPEADPDGPRGAERFV